MGFFNNSSSSEAKKTSNINWIQLTDLKQLEEISELSIEKPVLIFKHSTSCIVSKMALKSFEKEFDLNNNVDAYFLDLLNFRAISNEIATKFNVVHQSPQLLLIKNGLSIYNVSHDRIDAEELKNKI
jgi:bacillithiol system protein YtxJ